MSTNHTQTFVVVLRRTAAQPIQPQTLARELAAFLHAGSGTLLPAEAATLRVCAGEVWDEANVVTYGLARV